MRCFFLFFWPIRLSIIVIFFVVCFESVNFVSFFCTYLSAAQLSCVYRLFICNKEKE